MEGISFRIQTNLKVLLVGAGLCLALAPDFFPGFGGVAQAQTPVDRTLAPQGDEPISNVFRDMGVVQRRAMAKSNRFLISSYGSLDFSDGPYSMYGLNMDLGYAISDFWEIYANITPFYVSNPRAIVSKVKGYTLEGGNKLFIDMAKPKLGYGLSIVWAPAYGKDSLGTRRVIRSDTFFKFGASQIQYDDEYQNKKLHGWKVQAGVGKTYFMSQWAGFRAAATANYMQTYNRDTQTAPFVSSWGFFAIVEAGLVFYI